MNQCQCKTCLPTCAHPLPACCPDGATSGIAFTVLDANCTTRSLSGVGVGYSDGDAAYHTDGSAKHGAIKLNPEKSGGAAGLFARLVDGTLIELGHDAPDGSVLFKISGQWKAGSITDQKTTFGASSIKRFSGSIASFGCGPNGTLTLGIYEGCGDSLQGYDIDKKPICVQYSEIAEKMTSLMCENITIIGDSDQNLGLLVCTNNGIKKAASIVEEPSFVHRSPWDNIGYSSVPQVANQTLFSFNPENLPGYDVKYKTMWLHTRLIASSHGADYHIIVKIGAQEIHNGIIRENPNLTVDFINPTYVFPFPVSVGQMNVTMSIEALGGNTGQVYEWGYEMKLVAWQK